MCVCKLFRTFSNLGPLLNFIENLVELLVFVNSLRCSASIGTGLSLTLFIFYRVIFFIVSRLSLISALASSSTFLLSTVVIVTTVVVSAVLAVTPSSAVVSSSVATSLATSATAAASAPIVTSSFGSLLVKLRLRLVGVACFVGVNIETVLAELLNIILVFSPASAASPDLLSLLCLLFFSLDLCDLLDEFAHLFGGTSATVISFFGLFLSIS